MTPVCGGPFPLPLAIARNPRAESLWRTWQSIHALLFFFAFRAVVTPVYGGPFPHWIARSPRAESLRRSPTRSHGAPGLNHIGDRRRASTPFVVFYLFVFRRCRRRRRRCHEPLFMLALIRRAPVPCNRATLGHAFRSFFYFWGLFRGAETQSQRDDSTPSSLRIRQREPPPPFLLGSWLVHFMGHLLMKAAGDNAVAIRQSPHPLF